LYAVVINPDYDIRNGDGEVAALSVLSFYSALLSARGALVSRMEEPRRGVSDNWRVTLKFSGFAVKDVDYEGCH
jgi:hypothetical protein